MNNDCTKETDHVSDYLKETFPEIKTSSLREDIFDWLKTRPSFYDNHSLQRDAIQFLAKEIMNFEVREDWPIRNIFVTEGPAYDPKLALASTLVRTIMKLGREFDSFPAHIEKIRALDDR